MEERKELERVHTCLRSGRAVYPRIERVSERDRKAALGEDSGALSGGMTDCHAQIYLHDGVRRWGRADSVLRGIFGRERRLGACEVSE